MLRTVRFSKRKTCAKTSKTYIWLAMTGGRRASCLFGRPATPTSELVMDVPVEADGKYALHVTAATGPRSSSIVATLDGEPIRFGNGAIDLQTDHRVLLRNFTSPTLELNKGSSRLVFRVADGVSFDNEPPTFGIDFVWLQTAVIRPIEIASQFQSATSAQSFRLELALPLAQPPTATKN